MLILLFRHRKYQISIKILEQKHILIKASEIIHSFYFTLNVIVKTKNQSKIIS